jgi:hypothetical protein
MNGEHNVRDDGRRDTPPSPQSKAQASQGASFAANAITASRVAGRRKTAAPRRVETDEAADVLARIEAKDRDSPSYCSS